MPPRDKAAWDRMQRIYTPGMKQRTLQEMAATTENTARAFLKNLQQETTRADLHDIEIQAILKSAKEHRSAPTPLIEWSGESIKFAVVSDTHFGHKMSREDWWLRACDLIDREGCEMVFHPGDITEGMSGRPGHVYELDAPGVSAQIEMAVDRLSVLDVPIYAITGNHDAWAYKHVGVDIGKIIGKELPDFYYLGPDEADVALGNITIKLWHGGDGSSYATSYRTQKFVESLSGGEKPNILLSGHAHKAVFHECRNVMAIECGTLCAQTSWMRGKKLAAHVGFWIVEVWQNDDGIERIRPEWIPFYK